jgi:hypothetical protein
MSYDLAEIKSIIRELSTSQAFTCNVGIPWNGKDQFVAPIPFFMQMYRVQNIGDFSWREPEGETYGSEIILYSIDPISVFGGTTIGKYITFGFIDTTFTVLAEERTYRVVAQRKVYDAYYVIKGRLSI